MREALPRLLHPLGHFGRPPKVAEVVVAVGEVVVRALSGGRVQPFEDRDALGDLVQTPLVALHRPPAAEGVQELGAHVVEAELLDHSHRLVAIPRGELLAVREPVQPEDARVRVRLGGRERQALGQLHRSLEARDDVVAAAEVPERLRPPELRVRGAGESSAASRASRAAASSSSFHVGLVPRHRRREEQPGPLGVVLRPQLERPVVFVHGGAEGVEGGGAIAGVSQGEAGRPPQVRVLGCRRQRLQSAHVVVRAQLRVIVRPAQRLDPRGGPAMLLRPLRPRDLAVRDVADERVGERVLGVSFHRGPRSRCTNCLRWSPWRSSSTPDVRHPRRAARAPRARRPCRRRMRPERAPSPRR